MPTDFAAALAERAERDHDDSIDTYRDIGTATLDGLFRSGDYTISDNGRIVSIDLRFRRTGLVMYGTGRSLREAIDDTFDQIVDHLEAIANLENLGVDVSQLSALVEFDEYDPAFLSSLSSYDRGDPIDAGYAPTASDDIDESLPIEAERNAFFPFATAQPAPVYAAAGEPVDNTPDDTPHPPSHPDVDDDSPAYVLALLLPVKLARA